ncbi:MULTISPECIES: hypothetical protein [Cobetia]|uniref:hypothetical protein n=1 Tax=Cobetia TaxID=204286 RepID=UPI0015839A23|nr:MULTISPECIES: hypothetical protein [Cobetia]MDI4659657.1 hypothetical protein [Cobetia sp. BMC6]NUJ56207.1 hypothetical protein [Cobetia marina]
MSYRALPLACAFALGLSTLASQAVLADGSPAQQRAEEAAGKLDISKFLKPRSDAHSQNFLFGGTSVHQFTIKEAGRYEIDGVASFDVTDPYTMKATLESEQGEVVATAEGDRASDGLNMNAELEPGVYKLRVRADKLGAGKSGGNTYEINVAGLSESGEKLSAEESGIETGNGLVFLDTDGDGRRTAFVDANDEVATIKPATVAAAEQAAREKKAAETGNAAAEGASATGAAATTTSAAATAAAETSAAAATGSAAVTEAEAEPDRRFDEIVTDVRILEKGEVMTFDVADRGTVTIDSETFPGSEGTYKLQMRLLDESGNTVASDKGEGFQGDFHLKTVLEPGRYTVWVSGQKFGSSMQGVNNYTVRVQQLDVK